MAYRSAQKWGERVRLNIIIVQYYIDDWKLDRFVSRLCRLMALHGINAHEVRVDIRPSGKTSDVKYPFLDISGYRAGLARIPNDETVLLLNDTFFFKHPWRTYSRAMARILPTLHELDVTAAAGAVYRSQSLLMFDNVNPSRKHAATFFFALNPSGRSIFDLLAANLPSPTMPEVGIWLEEMLARNQALSIIFKLHFAMQANPWRWGAMPGDGSEDIVWRKKITVAFEYLLTSSILSAQGVVLPINFGTRHWVAQQVEMLWIRALRHISWKSRVT